MRLAEGRIKAALPHGELVVREAALAYFTNSFCPDAAIMPLAIQAVETYGWEEAFSEPSALEELEQTDETVSWLCDQLAHPLGSRELASDISWILAGASAGMLKRRRKEIFGLTALDPSARHAMEERTRLLTVDKEASWQELDQFLRRLSQLQTVPEEALLHIDHVLEAISRYPQAFAERVQAAVAQGGSTQSDSASAYRQLLMIRLAGYMRLEATAPLFLERLADERDWLVDEATSALIRIGSDSVVKALSNGCASAEAPWRDAAAWVLGAIHTDLAAEACLHLFRNEQDVDVKMSFGHAVLEQYEVDGIGPLRRFLLDASSDQRAAELRQAFLAVCTTMEAEFPELAAWREELQQDAQFRSQWQSPEFAVQDTWSNIVETPRKPPRKPAGGRPAKFIRPAERVPRNAPCPCNSGKKYKDCCRRARLGL